MGWILLQILPRSQLCLFIYIRVRKIRLIDWSILFKSLLHKNALIARLVGRLITLIARISYASISYLTWIHTMVIDPNTTRNPNSTNKKKVRAWFASNSTLISHLSLLATATTASHCDHDCDDGLSLFLVLAVTAASVATSSCWPPPSPLHLFPWPLSFSFSCLSFLFLFVINFFLFRKFHFEKRKRRRGGRRRINIKIRIRIRV